MYTQCVPSIPSVYTRCPVCTKCEIATVTVGMLFRFFDIRVKRLHTLHFRIQFFHHISHISHMMKELNMEMQIF